MMDTVLFTDQGIVIFAILTSATALILSVLGLATTHQIRFDMKDDFRRAGAQPQAAENYTSRDTKPKLLPRTHSHRQECWQRHFDVAAHLWPAYQLH